MKAVSLFVLLFIVSLSGLWAQEEADDEMGVSVHFDMTGFPQWSRDLRRASIVAFGSFPFMYLFANFGFDSYRFAAQSWDRRYAPWPFSAAGSAGHSQAERFRVLGIAAGSAIVISIIDYGIVRHRRNRLEREARALAPGTPIIIRTPLHEEDGEPFDSETEEF